jgi:hypothetical protein
MRPLVFLDFDDVFCLSTPYGAYDVIAPNPPPQLWEQLFHAPAVEVLRTVTEEFDPQFVITTSWLRFLGPDEIRQLLMRCGLEFMVLRLHMEFEALQPSGATRSEAVSSWLAANHRGEPFVVLDDFLSGTGLAESEWTRTGRVVLCEVGRGLMAVHLPAIRAALKGAWRPN